MTPAAAIIRPSKSISVTGKTNALSTDVTPDRFSCRRSMAGPPLVRDLGGHVNPDRADDRVVVGHPREVRGGGERVTDRAVHVLVAGGVGAVGGGDGRLGGEVGGVRQGRVLEGG